MAKEAKYKMMFKVLDKDKSGKVNTKELSKGLLGLLPQKQLEQIVKLFDKDGDGQIDYEEFKTVMKRLDGGNKKKKNKLLF